MKPRSQRRRESRVPAEPGLVDRLAGNSLLIAGMIGVGVAIIVAGILLLVGGGDDDGDDQQVDLPGEATPIPLVQATTEDEQELEGLARRTIEALPNGTWAELYDDFTEEYRERCSREAFVASGAQSAMEQGEQLSRIRFVGVNDFMVDGDSARLVIVGEVEGLSEYTIGAEFEKVGGSWYISPVADTTECSAFDRLSG